MTGSGLRAVALLGVFAACSATPKYAVIFSAGQTDYAMLEAAPASSALYGFAYPALDASAPSVTITVAHYNGTVAAAVNAAIASAGSGNTCDAAW